MDFTIDGTTSQNLAAAGTTTNNGFVLRNSGSFTFYQGKTVTLELEFFDNDYEDIYKVIKRIQKKIIDDAQIKSVKID